MITLGFVVLSLVLYAIAMAFAFLYVRRDFQTQRRNDVRKHRDRYVIVKESVDTLEAKYTDLSALMEKVIATAPNKNALQFPASASIVSKIEDRYVEQARKEVKVGGVAK